MKTRKEYRKKIVTNKEKTIDDFSEYSDYKEVLNLHKCEKCKHLTECHFDVCICNIGKGNTVCSKSTLEVAFEAGKELGRHLGYETGSDSGWNAARAEYSDATGSY